MKESTQLTWVAESLHIPVKGMSSGLALKTFCLVRLLLCAWGLGLFCYIVYPNNGNWSEAVFLLGRVEEGWEQSCGLIPSKYPCTSRFQWASPVSNTSHISQITTGRVKCIAMQLYWQGNLGIFTRLLLDIAHSPFSFAAFNLYLSAVTKYNCEYKGIQVLLAYHWAWLCFQGLLTKQDVLSITQFFYGNYWIFFNENITHILLEHITFTHMTTAYFFRAAGVCTFSLV